MPAWRRNQGCQAIELNNVANQEGRYKPYDMPSCKLLFCRVLPHARCISRDRSLAAAMVFAAQNMTPGGLAGIRRAAQQLMDPDTTAGAAAALAASTQAIFWVTGNVHGNEESGADAALRVLYELAQGQKHWVQAMLHEDPYIPVTVTYDVAAWSNPLLMAREPRTQITPISFSVP
jgi:hypothetical protein